MSLINKNKENRDLFELISLRELPNDLRQTLWKIYLVRLFQSNFIDYLENK